MKNKLFILSLLALFLLGLGVRGYICESLRSNFPTGEMPFTMESALQYNRTLQVANGALPEVEANIEYPKGVDVRKTYSVSGEYVYAALAAVLPECISHQERVRWMARMLFCLGIPAMAIWVCFLGRSRVGGLVAGAFYAVALASVIRSTGQELSRENLGLPLLLMHLAFDAYVPRAKATWKAVGGALASALFLAFAVICWDLIQYYIYLWMLYYAAVVLRGKAGRMEQIALRWIAPFTALVLAGFFNPYLRAHRFIASPAMLLGAGMAIIFIMNSVRAEDKKGINVVLRALLLLLPVVLVSWLAADYGERYGHFGQLLVAKLQFLNVKPLDPALMTFEQRIMWVPALHSATSELTFIRFPYILLLSLVACGAVFFRQKRSPFEEQAFLLLLYVVSFFAFILFVRFQVFLIIAAAAVVGILAGVAMRRRGVERWFILVPVLFALGGETIHTVLGKEHKGPETWGRTGVYYKEMGELADWLEEHAAGEPVVASFGLSAYVHAYAGNPIVLHPKFESKEIRKRVEQFGENLFKGTEKDFRDWVDQFGVGYYIYSMGELDNKFIAMKMRYFVDALEPPDDAAARMFELTPDKSRYFDLVWSNTKYRVFKVLSLNDELRAQKLVSQAVDMLRAGKLAGAEGMAIQALKIDAKNELAPLILSKVYVLQDSMNVDDTTEQ